MMPSARRPTVGSLCSGIGGLELGIERALGARTLWQAELDPHAATVLAHHWPGAPNHRDLTTTDWAAAETPDVMCFGFPCQDISSAGRRAGIEGDKSALWFACADAVRVVRPRHLLVENVGALLVRGIDRVLGDLAEMGYDTRWGCLRSSEVGAPHRRERVFIAAALADPRSPGTGRHPGTAPRTQEPDRRRQPHHRDAPGAGGAALANPDDERRPGTGPARRRGLGPADGGDAAAGIEVSGQRTHVAHDAEGQPDAAWGMYAAAVARWAAIHGPPPQPRDDRGRLNPALTEWLLGYPRGWVTDRPIPRTAQLRVLGNSCQPQVAEAAARLLLAPLMSIVVAA